MWESCGLSDTAPGGKVREDTKGEGTGTVMVESNPWEQIKGRLSNRISSQAYQNWVMRTAFEGLEGSTLRVAVPDQVTKDWMEHEYAEDIRTTIRELNLSVERVIYISRPRASTIGAASAPLENNSTEPI